MHPRHVNIAGVALLNTQCLEIALMYLPWKITSNILSLKQYRLILWFIEFKKRQMQVGKLNELVKLKILLKPWDFYAYALN